MSSSIPGRNEPCPCGSGRKYKKCCQDADQAAAQAVATDPRIVQLVARAFEHDEWEDLDPHIDAAVDLFARGAPLEPLRFSDDHIREAVPDPADLVRMATPAWLARCEREMQRLLADEEVGEEEAFAVQVALHLNRRFGALSPIVEGIAAVQNDERIERSKRIARALTEVGIHAQGEVVTRSQGIVAWLEETRPPLLRFADWFALRGARDPARRRELWKTGIANRIADAILDEAERADSDELYARWTLLASAVIARSSDEISPLFIYCVPLRDPTEDEALVYARAEAVSADGDRPSDEAVVEALERIYQTHVDAEDYAGVALLDEALFAGPPAKHRSR